MIIIILKFIQFEYKKNNNNYYISFCDVQSQKKYFIITQSFTIRKAI